LSRVSFAGQRSEQRFFAGAGTLIALLCFAGFARSYYLRAWLSTRVLAPILHLHGLIMTAWIALFLIQVFLIGRHRIQLHRRLGVIGAWLAAVVVVVGLAVLVPDIYIQQPDATAGSFWALFVAFDGLSLLLFAGFVLSGLVMRQRSAVHKRLLLLASLSLLPPALGRIAIYFVSDDRQPAAKLALICGCILLVLLADGLRLRRLHAAFGWGAVLLVACNIATYAAQISA
jgi:hypothetical protein